MITYNNISKTGKDLPIYFYTACNRHPQESIIRPDGNLNFYQILFIVEGSGILKHGESIYKLKKGSAFFTATNVPVEYINTGGLVSAFLTINGTALPGLMKAFSCDGFLFYESVNIEKYLFCITRIIDEYYEQKREGLLSAMVYSFCMDFFEEKNNFNDKYDEVVLYIEKNFMKNLTLDKLAKIGNCSVSKLCHNFKEKFNCSVFEYILDLRLNYAKNLLYFNPKIMIKDVALSCGFSNVSYFCYAYKQKFNITPSQSRIKS